MPLPSKFNLMAMIPNIFVAVRIFITSIITSSIDINEVYISPRLIDYIYTECIQYKDTAYRNDWIVLPKTHDYIFKNRLIDFIEVTST